MFKLGPLLYHGLVLDNRCWLSVVDGEPVKILDVWGEAHNNSLLSLSVISALTHKLLKSTLWKNRLCVLCVSWKCGLGSVRFCSVLGSVRFLYLMFQMLLVMEVWV